MTKSPAAFHVFLSLFFGAILPAGGALTLWNSAPEQPDGWRFVDGLGAVYLPPETALLESGGMGSIQVAVPGQYRRFVIPQDPRWAFHRSLGWIFAPFGEGQGGPTGGWWLWTNREVSTPSQAAPGIWFWSSPESFPWAYVYSSDDYFYPHETWVLFRTEERWDERRWLYDNRAERWIDLNENVSAPRFESEAVNGQVDAFLASLMHYQVSPISTEELVVRPEAEQAAYEVFEAAFQPLNLSGITAGKIDGTAWRPTEFFIVPEKMPVEVVRDIGEVEPWRLETVEAFTVGDFRPRVGFSGRTILQGRPSLLAAVNRPRGKFNDWEAVITQQWFDHYLAPISDFWDLGAPAKVLTPPYIRLIRLNENFDRALISAEIEYYHITTEWRLGDEGWAFERLWSLAVE